MLILHRWSEHQMASWLAVVMVLAGLSSAAPAQKRQSQVTIGAEVSSASGLIPIAAVPTSIDSATIQPSAVTNLPISVLQATSVPVPSSAATISLDAVASSSDPVSGSTSASISTTVVASPSSTPPLDVAASPATASASSSSSLKTSLPTPTLTIFPPTPTVAPTSSSPSSSAAASSTTAVNALSVEIPIGNIRVPLGLVVTFAVGVFFILCIIAWCIIMRYQRRKRRERRAMVKAEEARRAMAEIRESDSSLPYLRGIPGGVSNVALRSPFRSGRPALPSPLASSMGRLPNSGYIPYANSPRGALPARNPRPPPGPAAPRYYRERGPPVVPRPRAEYTFAPRPPPAVPRTGAGPRGAREYQIGRNIDNRPAQVGLPRDLERALD